MAGARVAGLLSSGQADELPETFGYSVKRRMLGPWVTEQLQEEAARLSKSSAWGAVGPRDRRRRWFLEPSCTTPPFFGLASFTLLMPLTGVILLGILLVVLSYREVVMVNTRVGRLLRGGPGRISARGSPRSRPWR